MAPLTMNQWYAVSLAAVGLALVLPRFRHRVSAALSACFLCCRFIFAYSASRVLIPRLWWWSSVTLLQFFLFIVYLTINGLLIGLNSQHNYGEIARRCGILSSINMMPLFMAGRPSLLVSFLRLPLHVHHLIHHWMGRVSILQALLHLGFVFRSHSNRKHSTLSGIVTAAALGCILLFSLGPIRRYFFEAFRISHHLLAMSAIGALLWHVSTTNVNVEKLVFPSVSALLWLIHFINFLYNLRVRSRDVEISKFYRTRGVGRHTIRELDVIQVDIELTHPILFKPGQYVYLRVRDFYFRRIETHPFMISWWKPKVDINHMKNAVAKAQTLTILVQPINGLSRRLSNKIFLKAVSFDGPLGRDLQLEKYDNVFLAVKGIGLAGVLSYAKYLVELQPSPADKLRIAPRKLDLYWELEDNSQEQWAGPFLNELQLKNNARTEPILQVWCYFPSQQTSEPLVDLDDPKEDFQYYYPESKSYMKIGDAIQEVAANSVGKSIVIGCGVAPFVKDLRAITLSTMSRKGRVDFVETEYRPLSTNPEVEHSRTKRMIIRPFSAPLNAKEKSERRVTFI